MKNKKGFTLVELLAVIAILAVLVIIALPNVIGLFNEAKKNSFTNEVKEIYKTAQQQWMNDSMFDSNEKVYSRIKNKNCTNKLKLSGREEIDYYIKLNKNGKVINFVVNDGTYQYSYGGSGLNIEDIENVKQIANTSSDEIITFNCTGPKNIATFVSRANPDAVTPKDELKLGGENFYVISSNATETVLLAKYVIDLNINSQRLNTTELRAFSDIGYWDIGQCNKENGETQCPGGVSNILLSPYDSNGAHYCTNANETNCAYVYDSNSLLYPYVNAYAQKIAAASGVSLKGRLLSLEEAYTLKNSGTEGLSILRSCVSIFWLGSAYSRFYSWVVVTQGEIYPQHFSLTYGVRPVLVVSTSAL
jgi:prepilin-type N-terminal cleavage/methylation domain-containing protein